MKIWQIIVLQLMYTIISSYPTNTRMLYKNSEENNTKIKSNEETVDLSFKDYQKYRILSRTKYCEAFCRGCCLNNICLSESECKFLFFSTFGLSLVIIGCCSCVCCLSIIVLVIKLINKAKEYKLILPCNKQKNNQEKNLANNIAIEMT